jgi:hypothetical protein
MTQASSENPAGDQDEIMRPSTSEVSEQLSSKRIGEMQDFIISRDLDDATFKRLLRLAQNGGPAEADAFFNKFLSTRMLFPPVHLPAINIGTDLMNWCIGDEPTRYANMVKSTGFYWLAMAALQVHDYETAVFFMDAAITEEKLNGADFERHPTPTTHFLLLEGDKEDQAALRETRYAEAKLRRLIDIYNNRKGKRLTTPLRLEDVREKFLKPAMMNQEQWRTAATAFITFNLEWDFRNTLLDLRTNAGTSEPFIMHLSKGCALFETLLGLRMTRADLKKNKTLSKKLEVCWGRLNVAGKHPNIGNMTLRKLVTRIRKPTNTIRESIHRTGQLRNAILHNLGAAVPLAREEYQTLYEMIGTACLHVIVKLY